MSSARAFAFTAMPVSPVVCLASSALVAAKAIAISMCAAGSSAPAARPTSPHPAPLDERPPPPTAPPPPPHWLLRDFREAIFTHEPPRGTPRGKKGGAAGQAAEEVRAKEAQLAAERQKRSETERSVLS